MKSEGNIWALLWEQARTVPARRQRRLFDDTKEAEKVMTFLTGLSAGDLASLAPCTIPVGMACTGKYRLHDSTFATTLETNSQSCTLKITIDCC